MIDEITAVDPDLFTEPYVQRQAYALKPDWEMREYVCQENNLSPESMAGDNLLSPFVP